MPSTPKVTQPSYEALKPPRRQRGLRWIRENLFNSWFSGLMTIVFAYVTFLIVKAAAQWAMYAARWDVVPANIRLLSVGVYPRGQLWRYWIILGSLVILIALTLVSYYRPHLRKKLLPAVLTGWLLFLPLVMFILWGLDGNSAFPRVRTSSWGGLTLTLILALVGIACSMPIAVLLALGRRSNLPVISVFCTALIEVVRGMPLVAMLFMAHLMVPIFLPDFRIDTVVRAMIGFTVFTSAYMAENVRGGLQSVPRGQYDAALALGMSPSRVMLLVILPQAVRTVIPSVVGQFISLFKDTSLVAIIGLLDLLGIARSITANPSWVGLQAEVYLFIAAIYWIFCFALSYGSKRIERVLGLAESP